MRKWVWPLVLVCIAGCADYRPPPSDENLKMGGQEFTHVLKEDTLYYFSGPQQGRPPEGQFKAGTRVVFIRDVGSYAYVHVENGLAAYVPLGSLKRIRR